MTALRYWTLRGRHQKCPASLRAPKDPGPECELPADTVAASTIDTVIVPTFVSRFLQTSSLCVCQTARIVAKESNRWLWPLNGRREEKWVSLFYISRRPSQLAGKQIVDCTILPSWQVGKHVCSRHTVNNNNTNNNNRTKLMEKQTRLCV